jgi:hypothetical protein
MNPRLVHLLGARKYIQSRDRHKKMLQQYANSRIQSDICTIFKSGTALDPECRPILSSRRRMVSLNENAIMT